MGISADAGGPSLVNSLWSIMAAAPKVPSRKLPLGW